MGVYQFNSHTSWYFLIVLLQNKRSIVPFIAEYTTFTFYSSCDGEESYLVEQVNGRLDF